MHNAGLRVCASRCSEAINHEIDLTEVLFDDIDYLGFYLIRKGVAVEALGIETRLFRITMKRRRVIPARRTRLSLIALFLKEDAERRRPRTECCSNPRSESVPCRRPKHQNALGAIGNCSL